MSIAVVTFPGSNCDADCRWAVTQSGGAAVIAWHGDAELPTDTTGVVLPGGFSYGDYLRTGAIAARAPIMAAVRRFADADGPVLGICNGFQVLCEAGMLPGALAKNDSGRFVCEEVDLVAERDASVGWMRHFDTDALALPVAHGAGRYVADVATLDDLETQGRVAFRYRARDATGRAEVNGAERGIAGIVGGRARNVLGLMPHPERAADLRRGRADGRVLFDSLCSFQSEGAA